MSHTPGPWTIDFDEGNGFEIYAATPATLCICKRGQHPRIPDVMAANARLIAAAPELFHAALVAHGMLSRQLDSEGMGPDSWGDDEHEALAVLSAAIAKAEGK